MEATAQEEVNTTSKDQTAIVKGKRTKRQRLQSPIPFAIAATTSSTENRVENNNNNHNNNSSNSNNSSSLSPATSTELQDISTEEEEDMANCLILLAQGQSRGRFPTSPKQPSTADNTEGYGGGNTSRYSSRKFLEATNAPGAGKAGYYVYECKTCNRTFASFQALGGHRASHKKPKAMAEIERKTHLFTLQSDDEDQSQLIKRKNNNINNTISSMALSLQLSNRSLCGFSNNNNDNNNNNNNKSSNKVHECSICGAEFTSGQALGGHMRRHRAPLGTASAPAAATALSLSTVSATPLMALETHEDHNQQHIVKKARTVLSLDLDLNLPAPEDDQRELKFGIVSAKQQQTAAAAATTTTKIVSRVLRTGFGGLSLLRKKGITEVN